MGTSGSFKGSGGKDAGSLRDAISDWLGDTTSDPAAAPDTTVAPPGSDTPPPSAADPHHLDPASLAPMVRLWRKGGGGGDGPGGGGGTGGGGGSTGRSSGGPKRTVGRVAGPAGRASSLVRAYSAGDRQTLAAAGLSYDELRSLDDPLAVGQKIASVAFDTQPDGSIEDSEARLIVAELVAWMMEAPVETPHQPDEVVRHTIELMILKGTLNEVGSTIRAEKDRSKRRAIEAEIKAAARVVANKVELAGTGTTSAAIAQAIEQGVGQLSGIYGSD